MYPGETRLLLTTLSLIEIQLKDACQESPEEAEKHMHTWIQAATVFALIWGAAGIVDTISREKFDGYLKKVYLS